MIITDNRVELALCTGSPRQKRKNADAKVPGWQVDFREGWGDAGQVGGLT